MEAMSVDDSGAIAVGSTASSGSKQGPNEPVSGTFSAEQALAQLKSFSQIAWEECRASLTDAAGSVEVRWEVYSTWTLLLCIYHVEAEAERCRRTWVPKKWKTEAQALRHLDMENHSLRVLKAVLRWLRWSHQWDPLRESRKAERGNSSDHLGCMATYERTRRALQLQGTLPAPLQGMPVLHPDGPLQNRSRFEDADLQDEQQLLSELWICLRRGDLSGALQLCTESGQAWRTALLQGMLPFADNSEESLNYDVDDANDDQEDLLASMKKDWTERGVLDRSTDNEGNPWRRIWKEQCWDTAQRNLRPGSSMDLNELAIYGLCAGHYDAVMPACSGNWADRCFGEIYCLKEWLVERLLEDGHEKWRSSGDCHLGEGDASWLDDSEEDEAKQIRELRSQKLCGRLARQKGEDLEAVVRLEVQQLLRRLLPPGAGVGMEIGAWSTPSVVSSRFAQLQALLIESAWNPKQGEVAVTLLRSWLVPDRSNLSEPPFLVKQFASYFAIWQKELLESASPASVEDQSAPSAAPAQMEELDMDVDDIVSELVQELVTVASGPAWSEQCIKGQALELVAEHAAALCPTARLEAFARLLLRLGKGAGGGPGVIAAAAGMASSGGQTNAQAEVLKRCLWVFCGRFPREMFALLAVLVRRALHLDVEKALEAELSSVGPAGVRAAAEPADMLVVALCIEIFWLIARDKANEESSVAEALIGLEELLGRVDSEEGKAAMEGGDRFLHRALELAVIPLLTDTLLCLAVKEPESALALLPHLQASVLWQDAFGCGSKSTVNLNELEWYLGLCHRYSTWAEARAEAQSQSAAVGPRLVNYGPSVRTEAGSASFASASKAERDRDTCRDVLLDWARPRLAQDRPLLLPQPQTQTVLPDDHWEGLRRAVACRVLLLLLDCFEGQQDFQGAMEDLVVSVAQSPWLLVILEPRHARAFLRRLSLIPTYFPPGQRTDLVEAGSAS